jgi:hypothetical protein
MQVELVDKDEHAALRQLQARFSRSAEPGSGDLAEKFGVRTMRVGDEILLQKWGCTILLSHFVLAPSGFESLGAGENEYARPGSIWNPTARDRDVPFQTNWSW